MSNQNPTLLEQLRQAAWQGLNLRNRLLEAAEDLSPRDRERVRQTAQRIMAFCTQLREIAATLPTDPDVDLLDVIDDPDDLRFRIESALENYFESALDDLQAIIDDQEVAEEEDPEPAK
jgi:5-formyltetrahydrofolate cyclo-ligase